MSNPSGLVYSVEDPNGFITYYEHTMNNQVSTVMAGTGVWTYTYGGAKNGNDGAVMIDPAGGGTTWTLNSNGLYDHISYLSVVTLAL